MKTEMTNIVNFESRKKNVSGNTEKVLNQSYFFGDEGTEVHFGGAFVRSILEKLEENKEIIIEMTNKLEEDNKKGMTEQEGLSFKEKEVLISYVNHTFLLIKKTLETMKTPDDFDNFMSEESKELSVMSIVISLIIACSYNELDIRRMIKQKWLMLTSDISSYLSKGMQQAFRDILVSKSM